jgi:hypothetical protein
VKGPVGSVKGNGGNYHNGEQKHEEGQYLRTATFNLKTRVSNGAFHLFISGLGIIFILMPEIGNRGCQDKQTASPDTDKR